MHPTSNVKVTPTAADRALELAERVVSRTRNYAVKLRPDDTRAEMIAEALREYGDTRYNEAKEAAAKIAYECDAGLEQSEFAEGMDAASRTIAAALTNPAPVEGNGE